MYLPICDPGPPVSTLSSVRVSAPARTPPSHARTHNNKPTAPATAPQRRATASWTAARSTPSARQPLSAARARASVTWWVRRIKHDEFAPKHDGCTWSHSVSSQQGRGCCVCLAPRAVPTAPHAQATRRPPATQPQNAQADKCDGGDHCPVDAKQGTETVCRPAVGVCDKADKCDGVHDLCGADEKLGAETTCRDKAGGLGRRFWRRACVAATLGAQLLVSHVRAHARGWLQPWARECEARSHHMHPSSVPTQPVRTAGLCDVAEVCDGAHDGCPADAFVPKAANSVCRPAAGDCDVPGAPRPAPAWAGGTVAAAGRPCPCR